MKAIYLATAAVLAAMLVSAPTSGALAQTTSAKAKAGKTEYLRAAVATPAPAAAKPKRKKKPTQ
jgi:hypothetical protein